MSKQDAIMFLAISSIFIAYILAGVTLTKILNARGDSSSQKILAWIPILQMIPISKIMNKNFWVVFIILIVLNIIIRIIDQALLSNLDNAILYLIFMVVVYIPPSYYVWSNIAKEGQHENYNVLGVLSGLPIIAVFAVPYIAWSGRW